MGHLRDFNPNHICAIVLKAVTENKACNYMEVPISEAVQLHLILSLPVANMEIAPLNHVNCSLKKIVLSFHTGQLHLPGTNRWDSKLKSSHQFLCCRD